MKDENKTYIKVIQYIKDLIQEGCIKEGDRLPTERELSLKLNLSRNSLREALRTMETLGIIESRQGSGNYLVSNIGKSFTETLTMMLLLRKIDYQNISQVRRALEQQAFMIALNKATKEQLDAVHARLVALEGAKDIDAIKRDREFHHEIVAISENPIMIGIMESMSDLFEEGIAKNLSDMNEEERLKERLYHQEIDQGLQEQDLEKGLNGIKHHYDLIDKKYNQCILKII